MITDREIQRKFKECSNERPRLELAEKSERGGGRLLLLFRWLPNSGGTLKGAGRKLAEWYARYYHNKKRRLTKLGSYPRMSLAEARKLFRDEYAPTIFTGALPTNQFARARHCKEDVSISALFEAYVADLKRKGKRSWYQAERLLLKSPDNLADALGPNRAANSIEPEDIVAHLSAIHARGAIGSARTVRSYARSAYTYGLSAEYSYTKKMTPGRWGLKSNPAAAIPHDEMAYRIGERFLEPKELRAFWGYMVANSDRWFAGKALFLIIATGQRVEEILRLRSGSYDEREQLLFWEKTKNGQPHSIPVPDIAATVLKEIKPSSGGWYFPHRFKPDRHAISTTPNKICETYAIETQTRRFTPRDLRRTWKTLAGRAGITKDDRDKLQNHIDGTVSSRHYDRYDYLREKRAAMRKWNDYLMRILAGEFDEDVQKGCEFKQPPIAGGPKRKVG